MKPEEFQVGTKFMQGKKMDNMNKKHRGEEQLVTALVHEYGSSYVYVQNNGILFSTTSEYAENCILISQPEEK